MSLTLERDGIEVETPEIDKLAAIPEHDRLLIQDFLDTAYEEWGWEFGEWQEIEGMWPVKLNRADIMGKFFGIDNRKIDQEKTAILNALRERSR